MNGWGFHGTELFKALPPFPAARLTVCDAFMLDCDTTGPIRLALLLVDGFALMSYASIIEPFRAANSLSGRELYRWTHFAVRGDMAEASSGARLITEAAVGSDVACDRLFVLAAGDPAAFDDRACFSWLRKIARTQATLIGVSGGPYLLARAGLLDGHRATIHWEHAAALQDEFPDLALETSLFVIDRARLTCAGGTAGLDLALHLIAEDHSAFLAEQVGEWFIRTEPRRSENSQRGGARDRYGVASDSLLRAIDAMETAIEEPLPREMLATIAGTSLRQLERLARTHLTRGIGDLYLQIRLDRSAHLLRTTGLSVTNVALACGFRSSSHFSRRFSARFGRTPSKAR